MTVCIACCLLVSCATGSGSERIVSSDVEYPYLSIDADGYVSASFSRLGDFLIANNGVLTIPSVLDGIQVRGIYERGFAETDRLVKVVLPDTCLEVCEKAFSGCTSLKTVVLGADTYTVGEYAFENCTALKTVTMGENTHEICSYAFTGCTKLATVNFKTGPLVLDAYSFDGCTDLDITIPKSGVTVKAYAFNGWTSNQQIDIYDDDLFDSDWDNGCDAVIVEGEKYALSFSGNGNTEGGVPDSTRYYSWGTEYALPEAHIVREGYTFAGWVDVYGDSSVVYNAGDVFEMPQRNVVFLAKWVKN